MTERRDVLADAAIHLVATKGMRGLTHRAVDAQAGLPTGTTSAYFRTRKALIEATVRRIAELELREIVEFDREDLVDGITTVLHHWITAARERSLARYHCMLEATHHPELRDILAHGRAPREQAELVAAMLGSDDPRRDGAHVAAFIEGLLFYRLAGFASTEALDRDDLKAAVKKALRL